MKQPTISLILLITLSSFLAFSCSQETKKEEPSVSVTETPKPEMPAYDAAMDPMNVEAPNITGKFGDTLGVKFYEVSIKAGDSALIHTHPDYTLYIAAGGTLRITPKDGEAQVIEFKTGSGFIFPGGTHSGKNIGKTTIKLIVTDLYRPRM